MDFKLDEFYMNKALELAKKGNGKVNPNPKVGAIIVKGGKIIGQGYHKYYGGAHAEINALNSCTQSPKGATLYVNLEPCSHYGKTPPCALKIVESGIKRVVIGIKDPNPLVEGNGINILKNNDIQVKINVLENECKIINEAFIKYILTKNPFVVLKSASTLDGKIATNIGESKWITGENSRLMVHAIRNDLMAIMVGIETLLKDDPKLTTRIKNGRSPKAIIVDSNLRMPQNAKILDTLKERQVFIATLKNNNNKEKKNKLLKKGVEILEFCPNENNQIPLKELMNTLGKLGIDSVLLEGGGTLNFSALEEKIVDKIMCFISPKIFGGANSKSMISGFGVSKIQDAFKVRDLKVQNIEEDLLITGYIK